MKCTIPSNDSRTGKMDLHGYAVHISGLIGKALKLMHIMPTLGEHLVNWVPSLWDISEAKSVATGND